MHEDPQSRKKHYRINMMKSTPQLIQQSSASAREETLIINQGEPSAGGG